MKNIVHISIINIFLFLLSIHCSSAQTDYKVIKKNSVPGDGKWDFIMIDQVARRAYLSHGTVMQVVNIDLGNMLGEVKNTPGIHGIAIAVEAKKGFTSNGKDSTVTVFDLNNFTTIKTIKIPGRNPDHIIYEAVSKNIFVFNNKSGDVSIIDPVKLTIVKTVKLGGMPEMAVCDGKGNIYLNLEDKSELIKLDAITHNVQARWSLAPGEEPTGIAIDIENQRLFVGCSNKLLVVVDLVSGKVITTLPIGEGVDGVAFDPFTKLIFTSNGEGTVTVIQQKSADSYMVLENLPTQKGAKTIALDDVTHQVYIPVANYRASVATKTAPNSKPVIEPGTFGILVIGNKIP
jgi:YVTN family beta-propeller protein